MPHSWTASAGHSLHNIEMSGIEMASTCGTGGFAQCGQPSPCNAAGSGYHPRVHACHTPAHLHGVTAAHTSTAWLAPINMFVAVTPQTWRVCLTAPPPGKGPGAACATTHAHRAGSCRSVCRLGWRHRLGKVLQTLGLLGLQAVNAVEVHWLLCTVRSAGATQCCQDNQSLRLFSTQRPPWLAPHAVARTAGHCSSDDATLVFTFTFGLTLQHDSWQHHLSHP